MAHMAGRRAGAGALMLGLLAWGGTQAQAAGPGAPDAFRGERVRTLSGAARGAHADAWVDDPSIHVARVLPGHAYRLGLRIRASATKRLSVRLYDRWPGAAGAREIRLPVGGGLRGKDGAREYQWWFSVAKESPGSLLYVKVDIEPGFAGGNESDWSYRLFVVDAPRSPMNNMGRGVVYHRGPSGLMLMERDTVAWRDDVTAPGAWTIPHVRSGTWRPVAVSGGGLIRNGDFAEGLRYWRRRPEDAAGVGVMGGRLRLWSHESPAESGIVQQPGRHAVGDASLRLVMDVMIESQTEPAGAGRAPLMLTICYEDARGGRHCGDEAFRKYFSISSEDRARHRQHVIVLPAGVWSRYSVRLDEAISGLRRILSVGLSGAGAPEREAWVEQVTLHSAGR